MGTRTWRGIGVMLTGVTLILALGGCYEHTFTVGAGAPQGPVVYDHWENFWLGGLSGHTRLDLRRMCPSGNATVYARQTFLNGLVAGLTSGIYTPTTVTVRCVDGRLSDLDLSAEDMQGVAESPHLMEWVDNAVPERHDDLVAARQALADR